MQQPTQPTSPTAPTEVTGGCGCGAGPGNASFLLAMLALVGLASSRRRRLPA